MYKERLPILNSSRNGQKKNTNLKNNAHNGKNGSPNCRQGGIHSMQKRSRRYASNNGGQGPPSPVLKTLCLRIMGQNPHRMASGQGVIASGAKQSLLENRDCFVANAPRNDRLCDRHSKVLSQSPK